MRLKFSLLCGLIYLISFSFNAVSKDNSPKIDFHFASIQFLIEQEVGRIVLAQIYKNVGLNIDISPLPGDRAQFVARSGNKDGEIMRIWTYGEENESLIRVPTSYYYLETMPFVIKGRKILIRKATDLGNYKLAKVRGVKHTNNITKGLTDVYEMNSTENIFKLLRSGRVDIALTNTLDGNLVSKRLGYDDIQPLATPLAKLPLYHYIHKKNKHLVPIIDKEIKRLKISGVLEQLIADAEKIVINR